MSAPSESANNKSLLSGPALAVKISVHKATIARWVRARVIPSLKVGRTRRFDLSDVVETLKSNHQINPIGGSK